MTTKITNKATFVTAYREAEKRATPAAQGLAFTVEDRIYLTGLRRSMALTVHAAADAVTPNYSEISKHMQRFAFWEEQIKAGEIRTAPAATGEHTGTGVGKPSHTFDGRIRNTSDIQPAFNKAAVQLVKLGITSPEQAMSYVTNGFAHARSEQKIDIQADRFVADLRTVGMNREQAKEAFDRALAQM